jgi:glycosyltransferase involved in cell wall biosynthesis
MKILHYALGFPPYRSGGLTKYCIDLLLAQKEAGHDVAMMWPGAFSFSGHFVRLKKGKKLVKDNGNKFLIDSFEIINPLPVPLDEGIVDVKQFTKKCPDSKPYEKFLKMYCPDAIHIHTLMGLHREFVVIAKKLGIKIVFTTHDYFGICPKVTLFRNEHICDGDCRKCGRCNESALSMKKIRILQSGFYRNVKDMSLVKKMRAAHRNEFFNNDSGRKMQSIHINMKNEEEDLSEFSEAQNINQLLGKELLEEQTKRYERLRNYYLNILKMVDYIHFNSTVTESVYRKFLPDSVQGSVINITHRNIKDYRRIKSFNNEKLRITYLAPAKNFKGYGIMKQALDELWIEGKRSFHLTMYNEADLSVPYITVNPHFEYKELGMIFEETDVLIMPSVWNETFGFTVLEALSYGVPVIVSKNVGAKDLLEDGRFGMIVEPTVEGVKQGILRIMENKDLLIGYNKRIAEEMDLSKTIMSAKQIEKLYLEK